VSPLKQVGKHYGKGTLVGLYDGSVRMIPATVKERDLRSAITPDDGGVIGPSLFGDDEDDDRPRRGKDRKDRGYRKHDIKDVRKAAPGPIEKRVDS
jgi:hypothetical protein